jgi:transcription antitermination factor NusG
MQPLPRLNVEKITANTFAFRTYCGTQWPTTSTAKNFPRRIEVERLRSWCVRASLGRYGGGYDCYGRRARRRPAGCWCFRGTSAGSSCTRCRKGSVKLRGICGRKGYAPSLPQIEKTVRHARQLKTVRAPLFPNYLFIVLDLGRDRWLSVRSTVGVARLLTRSDGPIAVPEVSWSSPSRIPMAASRAWTVTVTGHRPES